MLIVGNFASQSIALTSAPVVTMIWVGFPTKKRCTVPSVVNSWPGAAKRVMEISQKITGCSAQEVEGCYFWDTPLLTPEDKAVDGLRLIDRNYRIIRANQTFVDMAGISKEEAIGRFCYDVLPGPQCHRDQCSLKLILRGQHRVETETSKMRATGEEIPCAVTATPFCGPNGEILGIVETTRDITELKMAEKTRRRQQKLLAERLRFEKALNKIAEIVLANDHPEKILEVMSRIIGETLEVDRTMILDVNFDTRVILSLCGWLNPATPNLAALDGKFSLDNYVEPNDYIWTGKIVPGYEAKIVDADGVELPKDEVGTLMIKGESIAAYYWNKHDKSKDTFKGDWINTGTVGETF